jgi:hypothetical protein
VQVALLSVHARFYAALALDKLANEVPLKDVASEFGFNRGYLQSLQQSAATYAGETSNPETFSCYGKKKWNKSRGDLHFSE